MKTATALVLCAVSMLLAAAAALAADFTAGAIRISDPWSRATPDGAKVAAGYLTIINTGKEPDRLIGGTAVISTTFEIHEMTMVDNIMRMRALPKGLEIKPGETVRLQPGGLHVMFLDLKQPPKEGRPIKGTLVFERAGKVEIEYRVAPPAGRPPPHAGGAGTGTSAGAGASGGHGKH